MEKNVQDFLLAHGDELLKKGQELIFQKGQVLFYEGHLPYGLFFLLSGNVQFTRDGAPTKDNHRWTWPQGVMIGCESFFNENPYCCTCTVSQDCFVIFISKTQLINLLKHYSQGENILMKARRRKL